MHVFFVTSWFPTEKRPSYGIFVLEHARAVARINTVSLLHLRGIDPELERSVRIDLRSEYPEIAAYDLSLSHSIFPFLNWIRQLNGAVKVYRIASKKFGRPDIIHAHIGSSADTAVLLGRLMNRPVVLSEQSSAYARHLLTARQIRRLHIFMNRVDLIMPVSEALGQKIREYKITRPMITVQNVVDTEMFHPALTGEQVTLPCRELALIARLSEEKAVHIALEGMKRAQERGIFFRLHIAGDGPERTKLESLKVDLGLSDWVHFHGYQPKSELAKILRRSSAFMLTSLWDSQPVVIMEALSCGLPVVASAVGGIPEVITTECGLLFQPGNPDDLADKLSLLFERLPEYDPEAIHQYTQDHFSPEVVGRKLDTIYKQIIANRHAYDNFTGMNLSDYQPG